MFIRLTESFFLKYENFFAKRKKRIRKVSFNLETYRLLIDSSINVFWVKEKLFRSVDNYEVLYI